MTEDSPPKNDTTDPLVMLTKNTRVAWVRMSASKYTAEVHCSGALYALNVFATGGWSIWHLGTGCVASSGSMGATGFVAALLGLRARTHENPVLGGIYRLLTAFTAVSPKRTYRSPTLAWHQTEVFRATIEGGPGIAKLDLRRDTSLYVLDEDLLCQDE